MVNSKQATLIRKELKGVVKGGRLFMDYMLVPLITAVVVPAILILTIILMEDGEQLEQILAVIPNSGAVAHEDFVIVSLLFNGFLPMIFLMTPIMVSTAMAAASFTGEKERRTLETLLYSPMSLREIFNAKVIGSFLLSMIVTLVSFSLMVVVIGLLVWITLGEILVPGLAWLAILGLVAPAFAFIGIVFQVRLSAKARNSQEAFQQAGVLVVPLVMLIVTQSTGLLMVNTWLLLAVGFGLAGVAWMIMRTAFKKFTYEKLLSND